MARIRTIKPEFCTSSQLVDCSTNARLLFVLMWMFCDDRGVHPANPRSLKMQCFPGDDFSIDEIALMVDELIHAGLLGIFSHNNQRYWYVTGWHHQRIDRPNFKYPSPDEGSKIEEHSTITRRSLDELSPPEGKGREGSLKEGNYHIPSDVKLTPGIIAKTLRPLNISITSQNPILLAWISDGFTLDEITESVDICKTKLGDKKPIAAKYLDAVIRSERTQQPTSRDKPNGANGKNNGPPWWSSEKGIEAKGRELGMWPARAGESWQAYKGRVEAKLQEVKS